MGRISSSDIGSGNEEWLTGNLGSLHSIALDPIKEKMYWMVAGPWNYGIQRANLDGSEIETVINTSSDTINPLSSYISIS